MKSVCSFKRPSGTSLCELILDGEFVFSLSKSGKTWKIPLYRIGEEDREERNLYLGHTLDEVLASGKDILGEALMCCGDPEYSEVKGAMPKITEKAYAFLGGPSSWAGVTVNADGVVIPQESGRDRNPKPIFSPSSLGNPLTNLEARQMLLGKEYPILITLFTDGIKSLELMYFVEPGDSDRDPIVWIRVKEYENAAPEACRIKYRVAAISREGDEALLNENPPTEDVFLDALCDTVVFWLEYSEAGVQFDIPEVELSRVARGAVSFAALTFTADHPHYGHRFYGKELHDNFPPNYLWTIEAACLSGRAEWARGIFNHLLNYALNDEGRICYRQGTGLNFGVSATEYGMLLYLADKYKNLLGLNSPMPKYINKFLGMANEILSHCVECHEFEGRLLVKMCAEADTNERVYVYLNNNLWAVRGFESLVRLLDGTDADTEIYSKTAKILLDNVNAIIEKESAKNTRFGNVPPFRFGYTAEPLTLSECTDTFRPMLREERDAYFSMVRTRGPGSVGGQDFIENTYSNYRYYPEALCSMLLSDGYANSIVKMRENIGGELLGMTRFRSWIDNWPVVHYARFLIESGRTEKFLLLLYAHTAHHGRADLMAYYEQIKIFGEVRANDCVPSLLTTPIMLAWTFAYERVSDGALTLLSALPKAWYVKPFSVKRLGYSGGEIDIASDGETISLKLTSPTAENTELVWRALDKLTQENIKCGSEFIKEIRGNRLILKPGITEAKFVVK